MAFEAWTMPCSVHRLISECAEADYPDETCGFVFGCDEQLQVVPMKNIQNKLHAEDPERHPRNARTAYYFDPVEMQTVLTEKEKANVPLRAVYHSHPDHAAYFSATDSAAAAPFGEPSYPGVVYLVYSVRDGKAVDWKAFDWSDADERYVEVPLEIVDD